MQTLKIGLLGLGNIGRGVYALVKRKKSEIAKSRRVLLDITRIGDRGRAVEMPEQRRKLTQNLRSIVRDPAIDVIVELIGGIHPALELTQLAFACGKDVVTANKALLAEKGDVIFRTAEKYGRQIFFEAGVGGGIPVIDTFRQSLAANRIQSIYSIINGTSNYILSRMADDHLDFKQALTQAKEKGYAEANPALDIEGGDAAHKLTIMASLAFGRMARFGDVHVEGISQIRSEDIEFAREFGYCVKLLAIAKKTQNGIEARVQPTLLPQNHLLARVDGSFNAILIQGDEVGEMLLYGRGAGRKPTASAVVSDLVTLAEIRAGRKTFHASFPSGRLGIKKISDILSRYYLRFHVVDQPGILSKISAVLGRYHISISDVIQKESKRGGIVPLILLTHDVREDALRRAVHAINQSHAVRGRAQVLRIEGRKNGN